MALASNSLYSEALLWALTLQLPQGSVLDLQMPLRKVSLQFRIVGAGEMAQHLRALVAFPEDIGSIPSTLMVAHNNL